MPVLYVPAPPGAGVGIPNASYPQTSPPFAGLAQIIYPQMSLGSILFNTGVTDANGVGWLVNQLDGWDYPTLRESNTGRSHDDGIYNDPGYYGQRLLVAHGYFFSRSALALMAAREQLHSSMNVTRTLTPFVINETPPKMCMVRQTSGSKDAPVQDAGGAVFQFQLQLLAPDPRKYDPAPTQVGTGQPITTGGLTWPMVWPLAWGAASPAGVIFATNKGTIETRPRLTVTGPCINPVLENRTMSKTLTFATQLFAGEQLVVDLFSRSVMVDGTVPRRGSITSTPDQWWGMMPGVNEIHFRTGDGVNTGATLSVAYSSAWI